MLKYFWVFVLFINFCVKRLKNYVTITTAKVRQSTRTLQLRLLSYETKLKRLMKETVIFLSRRGHNSPLMHVALFILRFENSVARD